MEWNKNNKVNTYSISFTDGVGHLSAKLSKEVRLVDGFVRDHKRVQLLFQLLVVAAHQREYVVTVYNMHLNGKY